MQKLGAEITQPSSLSASDRQCMYEVYAKHYDSTTKANFTADLDQKTHVLVLRDPAGIIQGFSTFALFDEQFEGQNLQVVFSGDTVINRSHWGSQALAYSWIECMGRIKAAKSDIPLYWLLIVKGHRTYRYLPAFSNEFYPHWSRPMPLQSKRLLDQLAVRQFGSAYMAEKGLVQYANSRGHLKPEFADISEAEARRDDVSYFLQRNPGYAIGDELVCLIELSETNLRPISRRQFVRGLTA